MISLWLFQQRGGNRFSLLIDAEQFYPAMLTAIDSACHYVLFEQYIKASGRVAYEYPL